MSVGTLDHYNVSTRKLKETVQFYEDVLGFTDGPRPPFNFPGAWLYNSGHPVLHLNDISQTARQQPPDSAPGPGGPGSGSSIRSTRSRPPGALTMMAFTMISNSNG
jgi:catechol 2,3-dioxygenase-like lactoylglutathione lyase family enzyme